MASLRKKHKFHSRKNSLYPKIATGHSASKYNHPMPDLFDHALGERMQSEAPLAARMRPRTLKEFI